MPSIRLADAAAHFKRSAAALRANLLSSEAATLKEAKAQAVLFSSGTLTTATLRRMGHPYAVRNPTAPDPGKINVQTGVFRAAFNTQGPTISVGAITSSVSNGSLVAGYLANGTRFMIARPLAVMVQIAVQPARLTRTRRAVARAFTKP